MPAEVTTDAGLQAVMTGHYDVSSGVFSPFQFVARDTSGRLSFGDPKFAALPDGTILMWLWAFVNATEETVAAHLCASTDNGRSWSAPRPTPIVAQASALLTIDDARVIVAGNVRTPPEGIRLWQSPDAGQHWDEASPIQMWDARSHRMLGAPIGERAQAARDPSDGKLWESLPGFTFGSPDLVPAEEGVSLLTYYVMNEGFAEVRACRFVVD